MSETTRKMPNRDVLRTLHKKHSEVKTKTASIKEELAERLEAQKANGNLRPAIWATYKKIVDKAEDNEIAAKDMAADMMWAIEAALEDIGKSGHTGDIVELARQGPKGSAPPPPANDGMPLDEAEKAFKKNAHKAPKPSEVAERAEKRSEERKKGGRKAKAAPEPDPTEDWRAALRAEIAEGDQHIKDVNESLAEQDEPPPAPTGLPGADAPGSYRIQ